MARVTLQTIADHVGVSRMTVSNAFSRPDQLSAELRARILDAAAELGYVGPDPAARALAKGTTGAVGVLLTDSLRYAFTDEVATGFLGAVVDELASTGLALTLLTTGDGSDVIPARDVAIDGAIVYSCRVRSPARDWLVRRRLPIVSVDQDPEPGVPCVNVADRDGARLGAEHVLALGHRRVAILAVQLPGSVDDPADLTGETVPYAVRERTLGWLDALGAAAVEPAIVTVDDNHLELAESAALDLLTGPDRPSAVLCFSDVLAVGVVRAARRLGLDVPGDVSVVGFDDAPLARRVDPPLTTVRQDIAAKGRLATAALKAAMAAARDGGPAPTEHHLVPVELVVRATTSPPRP